MSTRKIVGAGKPGQPPNVATVDLAQAGGAPLDGIPLHVKIWFDAAAVVGGPAPDGSLAARTRPRAPSDRAKADNTRAASRSAVRALVRLVRQA